LCHYPLGKGKILLTFTLTKKSITTETNNATISWSKK